MLVEGELALVDAAPEGGGLPARSLIAFGPGARSLKVLEAARFIRLDPDPLTEVAAGHVELIPELLRAIKLLIEPGPGAGEPPDGPAPEAIEMGVSP